MGLDADPREIGSAWQRASESVMRDYSRRSYYLHRDLFLDTLKSFASAFDRAVSEPIAAAFHARQRDAELDVVNLRSHVAPDARRVLFRASDAVLANSSHEPFGLVGLETMAAGGIAFTGCSGEDHVMPGQNALVLETGDPREFIGLYQRLRSNPEDEQRLRKLGRSTARHFAWPEVIQRVLLPRVELERMRTAEGV
jgi:glycosyltransferase involved in cell wall biosynthesis